jgi:hypothetical protein
VVRLQILRVRHNARLAEEVARVGGKERVKMKLIDDLNKRHKELSVLAFVQRIHHLFQRRRLAQHLHTPHYLSDRT